MLNYERLYDISRNSPLGINIFIEHVIKFLYVSILRPGDLVLDGGANRGFHTMPLARAVGPAGRVLAYEPVPMLAKDLRALVAGAGKSDVVRVREVALTTRSGSTDFCYVANAHTRSGIYEQENLSPELSASISRIRVSTSKIDDEIESEALGKSVRFIKLDLEGGEYDALGGALETLGVCRPLVVFEHGGGKSARTYGYTREDFFYFFESNCYKIFDIYGRTFEVDCWDKRGSPPYLIACSRGEDLEFVAGKLPLIIENLLELNDSLEYSLVGKANL